MSTVSMWRASQPGWESFHDCCLNKKKKQSESLRGKNYLDHCLESIWIIFLFVHSWMPWVGRGLCSSSLSTQKLAAPVRNSEQRLTVKAATIPPVIQNNPAKSSNFLKEPSWLSKDPRARHPSLHLQRWGGPEHSSHTAADKERL